MAYTHITLSQVFMRMKRNHIDGFSIKYRRADKTVGTKNRVVKTFVKTSNVLLNRTVSFTDLETGRVFEISRDKWLMYDGMKIDHEK